MSSRPIKEEGELIEFNKESKQNDNTVKTRNGMERFIDSVASKDIAISFRNRETDSHMSLTKDSSGVRFDLDDKSHLNREVHVRIGSDITEGNDANTVFKNFNLHLDEIRSRLDTADDREIVEEMTLEYVAKSNDVHTLMKLVDMAKSLNENDKDVYQSIINIVDPQLDE